jgi:hypothetical protein
MDVMSVGRRSARKMAARGLIFLNGRGRRLLRDSASASADGHFRPD